MNNYINDWFTIIEQMNTDNTYKLAWGKAVIECIQSNKYSINDEHKAVVEFEDIAKNMLKYYWNQLFFFNLKQSPHSNKEPVICKDAKKLIDEYIRITNSSIPVWYDEGFKVIVTHNIKLYMKVLNHVVKTLHENVCHRFKNVPNKVLEIYEYHDKYDSRIYFNVEDILVLKEYSIILSKLLNYKWAQLLEKFSDVSKMICKINNMYENKLKRNWMSQNEVYYLVDDDFPNLISLIEALISYCSLGSLSKHELEMIKTEIPNNIKETMLNVFTYMKSADMNSITFDIHEKNEMYDTSEIDDDLFL